MYIGMYKSRLYENKFLKDVGHLFETNKIMPYIELIELKLGRTISTEEDMIQYYDECITSNYFLDFFTFFELEYKQPDFDKMEYAIRNRTDSFEQYSARLLKTTKSEKAIPVISIKQARENFLDNMAIKNIINAVQDKKEQIAVRIEGDLFYDFYPAIKDELRQLDYLFYDIKEETIDPYVLDIDILKSETGFKKVLANSPRKQGINNKNYLESGYTDLIDYKVKEEHTNYNFDGYADYSGLKDDLPKRGGIHTGAAIAIFYDYKINKYYTITNRDTNLGVKGYESVIDELMSKNIKKQLGGDECMAYNYVEDMLKRGKKGNFAQWNYITILRKFSEMRKIYCQ